MAFVLSDIKRISVIDPVFVPSFWILTTGSLILLSLLLLLKLAPVCWRRSIVSGIRIVGCMKAHSSGLVRLPHLDLAPGPPSGPRQRPFST